MFSEQSPYRSVATASLSNRKFLTHKIIFYTPRFFLLVNSGENHYSLLNLIGEKL
jgi:hypothetical protein